MGHSNGGDGIFHIDTPRQAEKDLSDLPFGRVGLEMMIALAEVKVCRPVVGFSLQSVGEPVDLLIDLPPHLQAVVHQDLPPFAHLSHELMKSFLQVLMIPVNIQMVGIHGGDHRQRRMQMEERTVELIGFQHHPLAFAQQQVGVVVFADATQESRTVEDRAFQDVGDQRGGGGLAVGAGYRHRPHVIGDKPQHFGPFEYLVVVLSEKAEDRMIAGHSRGIDHQGVPAVTHIPELTGDISRIVGKDDDSAFFFQGSRKRGRGFVVSGHLIACRQEIAGQGTHADTAYACKKDPVVCGYLCHPFPSVVLMISLTMSRAAAGRASFFRLADNFSLLSLSSSSSSARCGR